METTALTHRIKERACQLGFQLAGVCPASAPDGLTRLHQWLEAGYAGQMHYLRDRAHAYAHPRYVLDDVRSIVVLGMGYRTTAPRTAGAGEGRVSTYAWGRSDYHDLIRGRLARLAACLRGHEPRARTRGVVDTAPLLERDLAQRAGLGWIGKNTLLLNRRAGSWLFLAALLTDVELQYDTPLATNHCGTCRACLDACPTKAFPQPFVLDARRCISYLTIERKGHVPLPLRGGIGDWLFGCDICQEVCPWNRRAPQSPEPQFLPAAGMDPVALAQLFALDDSAFRHRFRTTPLWRPGRCGILRNAAIVLGNRPCRAALPALSRGLGDHEPIVRGACAWALGRHGGRAGRTALKTRRLRESDPEVLREIDAALG